MIFSELRVQTMELEELTLKGKGHSFGVSTGIVLS